MSALGVSQDLCPTDGDGVFDFPDGTTLALAVDTKNAAGATAASEAAVAGTMRSSVSIINCVAVATQYAVFVRRFCFFFAARSSHKIQGRTMRCC